MVEQLQIPNYGPITLFGSGETLPSSGKTYEYIANLLDHEPVISIIETPAGFQPNSEIVARKVADYISNRLQNYHPTVNLIAARKKDGEFSANNESLLTPMLTSNWIFLGPGSPTYAIRTLSDSMLLNYLYALHASGCALTFSSAVVLAISELTLPVYEIYKVGEELHWAKGLNFLNQFGLGLVFIPHWNNTSGGAELDTSRCFMGIDRFKELRTQLPNDLPIIGIDEQTSLTMVFENEVKWKVEGIGNITILIGSKEMSLTAGEYEPESIGLLFQRPKNIPDQLKNTIEKIKRNKNMNIYKTPPDEVLRLAEKRQTARRLKDWQTSDALRNQILALGWEINDTSDGYELNEMKQ